MERARKKLVEVKSLIMTDLAKPRPWGSSGVISSSVEGAMLPRRKKQLKSKFT